MEKEYIVFCDESDKKGKYYSNFYGGLVVGSSHYQRVTEKLNNAKVELNLHKEVKWEKVSENYLSKHQELMRVFFEEIKASNVRVRIMFRQNAHVPQGLTKEDREMEYFKLYYQFIKHGLGLKHITVEETSVKLRLYFDQFPDTKEKTEQFKGFLLGLPQYRSFQSANIRLLKEDITEVRSHDHILLQCLDIVLGSMCFMLNEKHKEKPLGQRVRGKKTIAKEKLYKTIRGEIEEIKPHFNIGISTGTAGDKTNRWLLPYLHWCFQPNNAVYDGALTKRGMKS